jgi:hypothetical protein
MAKKKHDLSLISYVPGASLFVRLEDCQWLDAFPEPMVSPEPRGIPVARAKSYAYDSATVLKKNKPLSQLIPAKKTEDEFETELNQAFAMELGIMQDSFEYVR